MEHNTIESIRTALQHSPDNAPLRMLLATTLLKANRLDEAEVEFRFLLRNSNDSKATMGLAKIFFRKGNYSACNVILEEIIDREQQDGEVLVLYAKGLLKEHSFAKAAEFYQKALTVSPSYRDEELDSQLRPRGNDDTVELPDAPDNRFLQKPTITFSDNRSLYIV